MKQKNKEKKEKIPLSSTSFALPTDHLYWWLNDSAAVWLFDDFSLLYWRDDCHAVTLSSAVVAACSSLCQSYHSWLFSVVFLYHPTSLRTANSQVCMPQTALKCPACPSIVATVVSRNPCCFLRSTYNTQLVFLAEAVAFPLLFSLFADSACFILHYPLKNLLLSMSVHLSSR